MLSELVTCDMCGKVQGKKDKGWRHFRVTVLCRATTEWGMAHIIDSILEDVDVDFCSRACWLNWLTRDVARAWREK